MNDLSETLYKISTEANVPQVSEDVKFKLVQNARKGLYKASFDTLDNNNIKTLAMEGFIVERTKYWGNEHYIVSWSKDENNQ